MVTPIASDLPQGLVYIIGQHDGKGLFKIGWSKDPAGRLRKLQTGSPVKLRIICQTVGSIADERLIHRRCRAARKAGEWFGHSPGIAALIRDMKAGVRPADLGKSARFMDAPGVSADRRRQKASHQALISSGILPKNSPFWL